MSRKEFARRKEGKSWEMVGGVPGIATPNYEGCADETKPKPHPAMLLELMDELAVQRHELLMIGDTSHDLGMAQSAGVDAIAVGYGAHTIESLSAWNPRASVSSVAELRSWLAKNA